MESDGTHLVWAAFHFRDRSGVEPFRHHLQPLFRIPLRVYALLIAIAYHVYDLLLLGGARGLVFAMDLLAGRFRIVIDDQKPEMGISRDDGFCASTDVFNIHDFRGDYSLD